MTFLIFRFVPLFFNSEKVGNIKQQNLFKNWRIAFIATLYAILPLCSSAQSWQAAYSTALDAYIQTDFENAIKEGERALVLASSANEKLYTLKVLSATYSEVGNYKKGLEYGKQEVDICNTEAVPDSILINSLNNLTSNYIGLQDYDSAIPSQKKMVVIGQSLFNQDNLEHNQHISDLGYSYLMTENYDSAIYYLTQANKYLINLDGGC